MENLKNGFYFETSKENAEVFANGFYFKKGRDNSTDNTHVLSVGIVQNGILVNENWTGSMTGCKFTSKFFCNDAVSITQKMDTKSLNEKIEQAVKNIGGTVSFNQFGEIIKLTHQGDKILYYRIKFFLFLIDNRMKVATIQDKLMQAINH